MKFKHIKIIALTVLLGGVSQCFAMQSNALSRVMKIKKTDIDGVIEAFSDIKTLTVEELAHCWNILKNSEKAELATDILNAHPEEKKKLDEYMMQVLPIPVITPEVVKEEASQVYNVVPSGESGKRHKKDRRLYYELPLVFGLKVVNEEPENKTCGSWGNPPMVRSGSDYDNYDEELSDLSLPNSLAKQMTQEVVDKMPVINDPDDAFNCLFDLDALVLNPLAGKIIAKCLDLLKTTEVYGIAVEMVANHSIAQAKLDEYRKAIAGSKRTQPEAPLPEGANGFSLATFAPRFVSSELIGEVNCYDEMSTEALYRMLVTMEVNEPKRYEEVWHNLNQVNVNRVVEYARQASKDFIARVHLLDEVAFIKEFSLFKKQFPDIQEQAEKALFFLKDFRNVGVDRESLYQRLEKIIKQNIHQYNFICKFLSDLDEYRVSYQGYLKWRVTEVVSMLAEKIILVDFYNALMHIKKADPEMYKLIIAPLAASATGVRDCREVICDRLRQVGMVNGCLATPEYAVLKGVLERDSEACQLAISLLGQSGVLSIDLQIALMELQDSGTQQVQEPFGKKRPSNHNYDD